MKQSMRTVVMVVVLTLIAGAAGAQMTGGRGHWGGQPATPPASRGDGTLGGMMPGGAIVGSDGTIFLVRQTDSNNDGLFTPEVVAIRPTGATAWTAALERGMVTLRLSVSGSNLLAAWQAYEVGMGSDLDPNATPKSQLVAFSALTGVVAWRLDIEGFIADIEPFSGGTYVVTAKRPDFDEMPGRGGMHAPGDGQNGSSQLIAVNNDGKILWTVPLPN